MSWDRVRCTYRAEVDAFDPPPGAVPQRARPVEAWWDWLAAPETEELPGRVVIGDRPVELLTVDALIHRLATLGFRPDRASTSSLFTLRTLVHDRCGSPVFLGRRTPWALDSPPSVSAALLLGLPDGRTLSVRPLLDDPDHGFGWGHRSAATVRTAAAMIDLAWSRQRSAATEATVIDLAISVLAEVRGGFVWRVESVADWIATETGELTDVGRVANAPEACDRPMFHQLSLELA